MGDGAKAALAALRRSIARIEGSSRTWRRESGGFDSGFSAFDLAVGTLHHGCLHETLCTLQAEASAASGFTLGLAARAAGEKRKIIWIRQRFLESEVGALSARGIVEFGIDPNRLILVSLSTPLDVLQAANDAARCKGIGAIVIDLWRDPKAVSLTATRRLSHTCGQSGVTCFLNRIRGSEFPTAAMTRWLVKAARSTPLKANAPGNPVFDVTLLRHRYGVASSSWRVEWNRDQRSFREPPLSRGLVSVSSDRPTSAIGQNEKLRRRG
jgi:protein ImuA